MNIINILLNILFVNSLQNYPNCKTCKHFIPIEKILRNKNDKQIIENKIYTDGYCKLFLQIDLPPCQRGYESIELCRLNEDKCSSIGKYYSKKIN